MPKLAKRLNDAQVRALREDGVHAVGDGLYLQVAGVSRSWIFRYQVKGRRRTMGLGAFPSVTLRVARDEIEAARKLIRGGKDPIDERRAGDVPTFGVFADTLVGALEKGFRNGKTAYKWRLTLGDDYCAGLRKKLVAEVTTADVLEVLTPVWSTKPETASKLRGRIEKVLDAAKAKGFRTGENPARWRGHLSNLLPK